MVSLHRDNVSLIPYESGRAPKDYGPGRICAAEGCSTRLRRTNPGPLCNPCQMKERQKMSARERILRMLVDAGGGWVDRPDDIPKGTWNSTLKYLRDGGEHIETRRQGGARLVSAETVAETGDGKTSPSSPQPPSDDETPADGDDASEAESAAEALPEPEAASFEQAGGWYDISGPPDRPVPFAGIPSETYAVEIIDDEVAAIDALQHALQPLGEDACQRVLEWAASRFLTLDKRREVK